jgi:hypothetical protein
MLRKKLTILSLPALEEADQVARKFSYPIEVIKGRYRNIRFLFQKGTVEVLHGNIELSQFSFIWLSSGWSSRDLAYAISLYLDNTQTAHSYVEKGTSKISDCMVFALHGLPIPETLYLPRSTVAENLSLIEKICGYPLIIKDIKGSRGRHSEFISSPAELLQKVAVLPLGKRFLFQRYIPNEYDWGIMVVNGTVVAGEKSYHKKDEFRNNVCNGGEEFFIDVDQIPRNIKDIAIKSSRALGLFWSRADIIIDKKTGEPYLLEVNRYPGITAGSDEVTAAFLFLESHIPAHMKKNIQ